PFYRGSQILLLVLVSRVFVPASLDTAARRPYFFFMRSVEAARQEVRQRLQASACFFDFFVFLLKMTFCRRKSRPVVVVNPFSDVLRTIWNLPGRFSIPGHFHVAKTLLEVRTIVGVSESTGDKAPRLIGVTELFERPVVLLCGNLVGDRLEILAAVPK